MEGDKGATKKKKKDMIENETYNKKQNKLY